MEALLQLDYQVFGAINKGLSNGFFDVFMPLMRNKYIWYPLYVGTIAWIWHQYGRRKGTLMVLALISCVVLSDIVSSQILKKSIQRERPCREILLEDTIIYRARCRDSYSFTSSHATNHFAVATMIILLISAGRRRYLWWLWAGVISFAQVYVGLHYPLDVLAGSILGYVIARLYYQLLIRVSPELGGGSKTIYALR